MYTYSGTLVNVCLSSSLDYRLHTGWGHDNIAHQCTAHQCIAHQEVWCIVSPQILKCMIERKEFGSMYQAL